MLRTETEIGTEKANGSESKCTDGGNVGTDVLSHESVLLMTTVMNLQYYHLIIHNMGR
jgi:hypothetical protein